MPPTIMYRERIARWIRTRRSRARFNELGASVPTRSSADCITIMSEFEFSAHTMVWNGIGSVEIVIEASPVAAFNAYRAFESGDDGDLATLLV
jgi:hypothetical protein